MFSKEKKADLQAALTAMLEKGDEGGSTEDAPAPEPAAEPAPEPTPAPEPSKEPEQEVIEGEVSITKEAAENSSPMKNSMTSDSNQPNRNEEKTGGDDFWAKETEKPPEFKLFVANMPMDYRKEDLEDLFQPYGPTDVIVAQDRYSGRPKGFAFISFGNEKDAKEAIDDMNGRDVDGKELKVEMSYNKPKPDYRDRPRPKSNVCYAWRHGNCDRENCRFDHFESDPPRGGNRGGGGGGYRGGYDRDRGGYGRSGGGGYRDRGYDRGRDDRGRHRSRSRDRRNRSVSRSRSRGRY